MYFEYSPEILARFPNIVGGIISAKGLTNSPTSDALAEKYFAEQQFVIAQIGQTPLSEIESLSAWRGAFRAFGIDPTQYRSACEALLRRLTKQGNIPTINALVDMGNLVSIRYGLPVAVLDTASIQGGLTVRFADGSDQYRFKPLGEAAIEHPENGEVIFTDETGLVVARRWCWRQSEESAAKLETKDILITVEGHHPTARQYIESAVSDLKSLLTEYFGSPAESGILDAANARFSA